MTDDHRTADEKTFDAVSNMHDHYSLEDHYAGRKPADEITPYLRPLSADRLAAAREEVAAKLRAAQANLRNARGSDREYFEGEVRVYKAVLRIIDGEATT